VTTIVDIIVTVADADVLGFAMLVAVTITFAGEGATAGAV
jgi:hypothetical protein